MKIAQTSCCFSLPLQILLFLRRCNTQHFLIKKAIDELANIILLVPDKSFMSIYILRHWISMDLLLLTSNLPWQNLLSGQNTQQHIIKKTLDDLVNILEHLLFFSLLLHRNLPWQHGLA